MSDLDYMAFQEEIRALKSENAHLSEVIERLHAYIERLEALNSHQHRQDDDDYAPIPPLAHWRR